MNEIARRSFLTLPAAALAAQSNHTMPTRLLGRTGVRVSMLGVGGHHIGRPKDANDGIRIIHAAMDNGITFMDNAWDYNNGRSEEVMGQALEMDGRRKRAFLMTKLCSREYAEAVKQLDESLKRLRTDYLDLWQFHECNYHNDPEYVVEKGALKAAIEARKAGKVRFIGFTGHKSPRIHLKMLAVPFEWDACQMPINVMDERFESFRHEVVPVCQKKNVGVIGMKGCGGDAKMLTSGAVTVEECYRYFLSQPVSVQVVGLASMEHLEGALRMARGFQPMTKAEMDTLQARIKDVQSDGRFELFKTSKNFDAGYHRKQHGFD